MSHPRPYHPIGNEVSWHKHLATPKQVRLLRRMGVPNAETIGFEEAHKLLAARFKPASA